ncbi:hypothetical protein WQE_38364 [Paraburkholderia hospita]|uniref:DUF4148 domain-containing protein n=1 Tax=Paraburkholderia hospita TaxID=169430 RepID=A0ABN0FA79_9BURK|nr:DUF4148 domain-containing protein [Paraburkholderia hospita]EIM95587.1 hypothetical protein WQE_38364 [Paraburkholderia hospita]OUL70894.1 hypothetical protein CA602_47270 [Paraburkholderia hospita]
MKSLIFATTVVTALLLPNISFAQSSNQPVTRARIHAELVQLEHTGYRPSKAHYPDDILAAERRVANEPEAHAPGQTAVGGVSGSMSQSGSHVSPGSWNAMYGRH